MKIRSKILAVSLVLLTSMTYSQENSWESVKTNRAGELTVLYNENEPFAYTGANNKVEGIEADILNYFVEWLWEKKKVKLKLNYEKASNFKTMFDEVTSGGSDIMGTGTVSITAKRRDFVQFSAPYLKNISVLVTNGSVPTLRKFNNVTNIFSGLTPVTIKGSIHEEHVKIIIKSSHTDTAPIYVEKPLEIINKIVENERYYGYIDIINYWSYVKSSSEYIKMHRVANKSEEEFAFIFPLESDWNIIFNEFFESGFGFTSTKDYRRILERHLGYEILNKVEIN